MITYDEFKEAIDNGFIKGDTVQIVRKNGKIHDYVLDGERVEPHETLSLEKVSDIIKELKNIKIWKHFTLASEYNLKSLDKSDYKIYNDVV